MKDENECFQCETKIDIYFRLENILFYILNRESNHNCHRHNKIVKMTNLETLVYHVTVNKR